MAGSDPYAALKNSNVHFDRAGQFSVASVMMTGLPTP
jgi:hypothetical protein